MRRVLGGLTLLIPLYAVAVGARADDAGDEILKARSALKVGRADDAIKATSAVIAKDGKNRDAFFLRGEAYAMKREHASAIKDYEKSLELDPKFLIAVDRRGGERFKLGQVAESIEDFDRFIKANPKVEPAHWRRGISYYYVAKYAEGAKQFDDGQVEFGADVENAFWYYLCLARKDGLESARKKILKLTGDDRRIPMMKIYDLIQGKVKADDVIETANKAKLNEEDKNEALFYANLYVGLNYEAEGNAAKCREHLTTAVEKHKIAHYMWDVGNVHLQRLKKK